METATQSLSTFDEAMPLNMHDQEFVNELHALLEKHDNLDRFGLCLLHDHFPVNVDEILLESNDHEERTLELKVVKRSDLTTDVKFTSWRIGGHNAVALTGCAEDKCKKVEALTGCAEDKCKKVEALTGCERDKCKK